jgi:hypothetical protein
MKNKSALKSVGGWVIWFAICVVSSSFAMALQPMGWQDASNLTARNLIHIRGSFVLFFAGPLIASYWLADRCRKAWTNASPVRFVAVVAALWIAGLILPVVFLVLLGSVINRQLTVDLLTAD